MDSEKYEAQGTPFCRQRLFNVVLYVVRPKGVLTRSVIVNEIHMMLIKVLKLVKIFDIVNKVIKKLINTDK